MQRGTGFLTRSKRSISPDCAGDCRLRRYVLPRADRDVTMIRGARPIRMFNGRCRVSPDEGADDNSSWLKDEEILNTQVRIVLRNCGIINPEPLKITLKSAVMKRSKNVFRRCHPDVIDEIKASGLRGRSGGSFPAGLSGTPRVSPAANTWSATPTKAIPGRLWIEAFWKVIRTL